MSHELKDGPCKQDRCMIAHLPPFRYQRVQFLFQHKLNITATFSISSYNYFELTLQIWIQHMVVSQAVKSVSNKIIKSSLLYYSLILMWVVLVTIYQIQIHTFHQN